MKLGPKGPNGVPGVPRGLDFSTRLSNTVNKSKSTIEQRMKNYKLFLLWFYGQFRGLLFQKGSDSASHTCRTVLLEFEHGVSLGITFGFVIPSGFA